MVVLRSFIEDPTNFISEASDGINYVASLSGDSYIAALTAGGFIKSINKGDTWGDPFSAGVVYGTIFRTHSTVGAAPAGRLIISPGSNGVIPFQYISDDEGTTITAKLVMPIFGEVRGTSEKIVQTKQANKYLYVLHRSSPPTRLFKSADGGDSWTNATLIGVGYGSAMEVREAGTLEWMQGTVTGFKHYKDVLGEGTTPVEQAEFVDEAGWNSYTLRSGYHSSDDMIGLANIKTVGAEKRLVFVTVDALGNQVLQYESGDLGLTSLDFITAVPHISGKWTVSCGTTTKARWYVSANGDPTSWSLLKEQDLGGALEGQLSNLLPVY